MGVTAMPYGKFLMGLGNGQFNFSSDSFKVLLTSASYTPNQDTHEFLTDITNEVTGTGYTAGGRTLSGVTWTYDSTNKRGQLGANAVTWSGVTITARRAVVYKNTGTASTSRLVGWLDFGLDKSYVAEDFQLSFPSGVSRIRAI